MPPAGVIVLCRHGETDGNAAGAFLSAADPPLNARGRKQCERARELLRTYRFGAAFASPKRRCVESLSIVAPGVAFEPCEALTEIRFGEWEGKTIEWLALHDPDGVARRAGDPARFRPPNGESFADVAERARPLAEALRKERRNVLVVGHRGTLGVLERLIRGLPVESSDVTPLELGEIRVVVA